MDTVIAVGTILHGYCNGFFGRDSYSDKRIEALGADWVVAREIGVSGAVPEFACFIGERKTQMIALLEEWAKDV